MKNSNLIHMLKKELREMFRDKKSLSMMLIIPLMIPLLVLGMSYLFNSEVNKNVEEYNKIGFAYSLTTEEKNIAKEMKIKIYEGTQRELEKEYQKEKIDLYITKEDTTYTMHGNNNEKTTYALALMNTYFQNYKEYLQVENLRNIGIENNLILNPITIKQDISEEDNFFANYIVTYAFLFMMMAITVSATYPATDATAGEKERGTLETLLTFPVKSKDIILGKFLSVSISSITTGILSLILTVISLKIANDTFELYKGINLMLSPISLIFTTIIVIFYSLLISGLCIAIASKAKTFKEAQSSLTPLTFITFFPGMIAMILNVKTTITLSLIPFLNYTLLFQDVTNNDFNLVHILCMMISTMIIIWIVLKIIMKQYKSEKVLFPN